MGKGIQVRFGRKNPGSERAVGVLGVIRGTRARKISLDARRCGRSPSSTASRLTEDLVAKIEAALSTERDSLDDWLVLETERPGLWPDELRDDPRRSWRRLGRRRGQPIAMESRQPVNRIYYGPPGTGKTYELSKLLKREYEQAMTSVSKEEWRSQLIAERIAGLDLVGRRCGRALRSRRQGECRRSCYDHPFMKAIAAAKSANKNVRNTVWGTLQYHTIEDRNRQDELRLAPAVFDKTADSIWQFAGDWKKSCADLIETVKATRLVPHELARSNATASSPSTSPTVTRSSSRDCGRFWTATRRLAKSSTRSVRASSKTCAAAHGRRRNSDSRW